MSTKRRAPHYSFRGRELFGAVDESSRLVNNPGPGAYGRTPVQGKNAPAYSLGVRAEKGKRRSSTPGPGMPLQRMVCAGGIVLTPRVCVCVMWRKHRAVQGSFIVRSPGGVHHPIPCRCRVPDVEAPPAATKSDGHWPRCACSSSDSVPPHRGSPGAPPLLTAGEYSKSNAVGRQASSKRRTQPAFSFGSASRFAKDPNTRSLRAGPGSYRLPGSIGAQPLSTLRSAPASSIASRHAFGSPYDV